MKENNKKKTAAMANENGTRRYHNVSPLSVMAQENINIPPAVTQKIKG